MRILFSRKIKEFIKKSLLKIKYFIKYRTTDFFNFINIETSTACNRRCSYCPNSIYDRGLIKNQKLMKEEVYKKIIDELADLRYTGRISPFNFGEPLLDKRIFKLVAYTRKKLPKVEITLSTNGDYLTPEISEKLKKAGLNKLHVSPHDDIEYQKSNFNNRGGLVEPEYSLSFPRCFFADNPMVIDHDGNVVLCCNDYLSEVKFGNVKYQKLVDIWNSPKYRYFREQTLGKCNYYLPICKKCAGGCK